MNDIRLWHGGFPGLKPSDLLLPPDQTGSLTSARLLKGMGFDPHANGVEADRMRSDRVYLTTDRGLARAYAACWITQTGGEYRLGRGALYVARPVGESWPDPDMPDGCIECDRAEIVTVYDAAVRMTEREITRKMAAATRRRPVRGGV
ncbi:hypothetical protein DQ384_26305 [Sphaerisporangium album]|uniref:Uncharacterized protein n=1 Tax=Sphaerisporangium album TaxID=509200 RepID=A0A367FA35_9ACTN|nr:hypothetical protein [Sphaerisporangium album]RCG27233.1 hypothetical protein DQ384_26305 [Sphaerisporangium album]